MPVFVLTAVAVFLWLVIAAVVLIIVASSFLSPAESAGVTGAVLGTVGTIFAAWLAWMGLQRQIKEARLQTERQILQSKADTDRQIAQARELFLHQMKVTTARERAAVDRALAHPEWAIARALEAVDGACSDLEAGNAAAA